MADKCQIGQDGGQTVTLFEDNIGRIVGNPQRSYGYLYVAAWLHSEPATQPETKAVDK